MSYIYFVIGCNKGVCIHHTEEFFLGKQDIIVTPRIHEVISWLLLMSKSLSFFLFEKAK